MRSVDDPASLSPDERLAELAGIFAAGVLRLRHQALPDVSSPPPACSAIDGKTAPSRLEVVSETVLSVRAS
jgi:hypothetical protein